MRRVGGVVAATLIVAFLLTVLSASKRKADPPWSEEAFIAHHGADFVLGWGYPLAFMIDRPDGLQQESLDRQDFFVPMTFGIDLVFWWIVALMSAALVRVLRGVL